MTALATKLAGRITLSGPITIADLMAAALGDPEHGYYQHRDPFGTAGDFITAPEISQMFGELIGLWLGAVWQMLGSPATPVLAELGPGRGTLMVDARRALAKVPGFPIALPAHLVETSPHLRAMQSAALNGQVRHYDRIEDLPDHGPLLLVANEFIDALPIRQWVYQTGHWHERQVGLDPQGQLTFGLSPDPCPPPLSHSEPPADGAVLEICPAGIAVATTLGHRLKTQGGAGLLIDYGAAHYGYGDTLQAVHRHQPVAILPTLGEADLTAHVNFTHLGAAAGATGATVAGPIDQGLFLDRLGIATRAERLAQSAPARRVEIDGQRLRLTAPDQMGSLFKVQALASPDLPSLPAF